MNHNTGYLSGLIVDITEHCLFVAQEVFSKFSKNNSDHVLARPGDHHQRACITLSLGLVEDWERSRQIKYASSQKKVKHLAKIIKKNTWSPAGGGRWTLFSCLRVCILHAYPPTYPDLSPPCSLYRTRCCALSTLWVWNTSWFCLWHQTQLSTASTTIVLVPPIGVRTKRQPASTAAANPVAQTCECVQQVCTGTAAAAVSCDLLTSCSTTSTTGLPTVGSTKAGRIL